MENVNMEEKRVPIAMIITPARTGIRVLLGNVSMVMSQIVMTLTIVRLITAIPRQGFVIGHRWIAMTVSAVPSIVVTLRPASA
ncbi:MAG: hypothetical protein A2Z83_03350 [Omnitrophica bacterium GWA2_52_8]|nr:MAG: hypothetical protein A2Z83_03350 [Omnitrophica bacterium GWA2_52_8]